MKTGFFAGDKEVSFRIYCDQGRKSDFINIETGEVLDPQPEKVDARLSINDYVSHGMVGTLRRDGHKVNLSFC